MSGAQVDYMAAGALRVLQASAAAGAPCPPNAELCPTRMAEGNHALMRLAKAGLVVVERVNKKRRVQIVATGQWTGWTCLLRQTGRKDADAGGPKMSAAEIAARRVDRDPCRVCGARGDAECGHAQRVSISFVPGTAWGHSYGSSGSQVQA